MKRNLAQFKDYQVYLNYPFHNRFLPYSNAMHFAVIAAGMLPVCALDVSAPDRQRLQAITEALSNCDYSVHDLSRLRGEGTKNFSRMNMPIELGMAIGQAFLSNRVGHRFGIFVPHPHEYKVAASDLLGLDPKVYTDHESLLVQVYNWLRDVVDQVRFNSQALALVVEQFKIFRNKAARINGGGKGGEPDLHELQELMYQVCSDVDWWGWRKNQQVW